MLFSHLIVFGKKTINSIFNYKRKSRISLLNASLWWNIIVAAPLYFANQLIKFKKIVSTLLIINNVILEYTPKSIPQIEFITNHPNICTLLVFRHKQDAFGTIRMFLAPSLFIIYFNLYSSSTLSYKYVGYINI